MAGLHKGKQDGHAQRQHLHLRRDMTTSSRDAYEVHDYNFAQVACKLPVYDGKYDSAAYINWELAVEKQFDEYDFSNAQMIKAASNKCTGSASFWWHTVGNKLETWDECKILMRKRFVFSYYRRALLEKWEHLKQGDKTVREYFHDFKICITYSGLQESNENTMTRFFRGLNFNIQAGLVNVTYNHIGQLFMLACIVERKILENPTEQQDMLVPPITDVLQEVQKSLQNEKNDMFEMSLPSLANEEKADAATLSEGKFASGLREEHHMEKPRTVFCEEGEDDVTMATMDTTIAHIMNQQEDIKIKSSMCCNLIRPRVTLLTSNGRQIYIRAPFWAREYLMESSRSPPSNGSSPISEFYLVWPQSQKQGTGLICTGKINNPRRGVSIAKAQHNVSYGCSRIVNVSPKS
uniref:Retrotransposon, putative, centromere-specific n=1 Tax=Oryza sativa subsp. japonica TaxID=39947 RepID=Q2QT81_ORYSJ|nr:retrotransposon, putative, centromere-specific [Oryza sativa Japonica Group]